MKVIINTKNKALAKKLFGYILQMANDESLSTSCFYRKYPATNWQQFIRYRDTLESKTDITVIEGFIDDIIPHFSDGDWDKLNEPEFGLKKAFEDLVKNDQLVMIAITEQRGVKEEEKVDEKTHKLKKVLVDVPLTDIAPIDLDEAIMKKWPAMQTMFNEVSILNLFGLDDEKREEQLQSIAKALVDTYVEERDASFNEGSNT